MSETPAPSFDELSLGRSQDTARVTTIDESWGQGRSTFGGLSTAFGYRHAAGDEARPPRVVTARLWAPIPPGDLRSDVTELRQGESVRIVRSTLSSGGASAGEVDIIFGTSRESEIDVAPKPYPGGELESGQAFPFIKGLMPNFIQHVDIRWLEGGFPYSGAKEAAIGGFCRHRTEASGVAGLLGLLDAWPAPVLPLLKKPFAASTVQWTAHFTDTACEPGQWFRYQSRAVSARDGYATMQAELWTLEGRYVAWTEQLVAVYG